MLRIIFAIAVLVGAALASQTPASAADPVYSPARLLQGEHSIESLLQLPPALPNGLHIVPCKTWVSERGRSHDFKCHTEEKLPEGLVESVVAAGRQADYAPATLNGRRIRAHMLVTVRISVDANGSSIMAVPNDGAEADRFGLLYTAPQRLTMIDWRRSTTSRPAYIKDKPLLLWQIAHVDERGKSTDFELKNASRAHPDVVTYFKQQLAGVQFIPGSFEGKATPMLYVEPWREADDD
jgi:hypothetical protein